MNERQERFADEYLIDCNATQAAIRAGYSPKSAYSTGQQLLKHPEVKSYISEKMETLQRDTIAEATEVMEYLTSVLRGESQSHVVVVEGKGKGTSQARELSKKPEEKDRLKAAELLGKRYGIYSDNLNVTATVPVVIKDDLGGAP